MAEASRLIKAAAAAALLTLALVAGGCGSASARDDGTQQESGHQQLNPAVAKEAIQGLPNRVVFKHVAVPEGATGALAGRAFGRYGAYLDFGVAFGPRPKPVPVPEAGITELEGFPKLGMVFTSNVLMRGKGSNWVPARHLKTYAQYREAENMVTAIEEQLCKKATGEPCPV
jgi:hypothetical protein